MNIDKALDELHDHASHFGCRTIPLNDVDVSLRVATILEGRQHIRLERTDHGILAHLLD